MVFRACSLGCSRSSRVCLAVQRSSRARYYCGGGDEHTRRVNMRPLSVGRIEGQSLRGWKKVEYGTAEIDVENYAESGREEGNATGVGGLAKERRG